MLRILSFLMFVGCWACTSSEKNYLDFFQETDTLRLVKMENISSDILGKPRDILVVGDYFVVRDEMEGQWFTLIRKSDRKMIRHFGVMGRGPQEILYPLAQEPWGENFYVYDSSLETLHLFSLDSLLQGGSGIAKSIPMHFNTAKHARCRQVLLLPSGKVMANCCHPEGRLILFDSNGYEQKVFSLAYPEDNLHTGEDYITKSFAFQYIGKIDEHNRFYNVSNTTGHIEVFQLENDTIRLVKNNLYYLPKYKNTTGSDGYGVVFTEGNKGGLFNPELSGCYLYAAYKDNTSKEHTYIAYNWLLRFDLEGKPLKAYRLSSRISGFFIEKENEMLYAIGADSETLEPFVLCYNKVEGTML